MRPLRAVVVFESACGKPDVVQHNGDWARRITRARVGAGLPRQRPCRGGEGHVTSEQRYIAAELLRLAEAPRGSSSSCAIARDCSAQFRRLIL